MRALLRAVVKRLRQAGLDDPEHDARRMLAHALDVSPAGLLLREAPLTCAQRRALVRVLRRRAAGMSLGRALGSVGFWTRTVPVTDDVLEPRPDSEALIRAAEQWFAEQGRAPRLVVDLGTGSGCLLAAALYVWPEAQGLGLDRSPTAIAAAQALLGEAATVVPGDWTQLQYGLPDQVWESVAGQVDLVLCNPPYIGEDERAGLDPAVTAFDPDAALFAGVDGMAAYAVLGQVLPDLLTRNGIAVVELTAVKPHQAIDALTAGTMQALGITKDLGGHPRSITLRCKG